MVSGHSLKVCVCIGRDSWLWKKERDLTASANRNCEGSDDYYDDRRIREGRTDPREMKLVRCETD